jgi:hypothetical protein
LTWIKAAIRPAAKHGADRIEGDPKSAPGEADALKVSAGDSRSARARTRAAFASGLAERFRAHLVGPMLGPVATEVIRLASIPVTKVQ